jgi:hypothetical protein
MSRKWFSVLALIVTATVFLSLSSCAYNQHLVSIAIQPSGATFGAADPTLFVDFKAFGTYVHPPQTKDITTQVTWQTDTPQVAQVTGLGVVSPNIGCGTAEVFATFRDGSNDVVSNSAHIIVDGPASQGCPQGGVLSNLAVTIGAGGTGTITSSPAGINCGATCAAQFTTGTTVTLTATPTSPSISVSWANCDTSSGTACTVFLQADRIVTATFN